MSKPTQGERIAVLEHRVTEVAEGQADLKKLVESVANQQQQMLLEFAKYRGTWGGIVLVTGALITVWGLVKDHFATFMKAIFGSGG